MYKILLADDEGIVIESLKFIIEKEFKDQCVIDHAKTGRAVIELAENMRPDIAIMDIQMPGINGIEAIRRIKERSPHIIFIIMTAYDKFSYAKEAVNLGVFEYLNKPIDKNVIVRVLKEAMNKIDSDKERISNELIIREKMETVIPILENGFVYNIILRGTYGEDIENYKTLLEIKEDYGYMAVLIAGDDDDNRHMTNAVGSSVRLQRDYSRIRDMIKDSFECFVSAAMGNKIALFIPSNKASLEYEDRVELIDRFREMVRNIKRELNGSFRLGVGTIKTIKDMSSSYSEALESLQCADGTVVHADDAPVKVMYEEDYPAETEHALFTAIEKHDTNGAVESASEFFDWMENTYPEDMDDIRLKVMEFVLWAEHMVYEQGGAIYKFQSRKSYLGDLLSLNDLDSIRGWFIEKINEACQNAQNQKSASSDNVIERAKKYIEERFKAKDMSLDDVSREVDMSPYYFSKLFKEETGENFIEYLTNIRIEKAKSLLNGTDFSMKEICQEVGYADPNYFSRAFKKNVGVTPTEYKEGIR